MKTIVAELAERRETIRATPVLSALATRLRTLLDPLRTAPPYVPEHKATLTRDGGVCPVDGARLTFDPLSPSRHTCPRCGKVYADARHHGAWLMRYHIWLSERAIHAAALGALGLDGGGALLARAILEGYVARYRSYPNRDNVLGPSRLFFSTYLESIWLVQIVWAAALLETCGEVEFPPETRDAVRAMVGASRAIIAEFDEGGSNRQVWNATAVLASSVWLGEKRLARRAAGALRELLTRGVGADGLWHEGENYHLFALHGFLHAAEWARALDDDLYVETMLGAMYPAPILTLLPDLTLPARGDAPFGVSVCQPRFAELWEIGRARAPEPMLDAVLTTLYSADLPEAEDPGFSDLAEQEINRPASRQRRERLGWKALLWMRAEPPAATALRHPTCAALDDRGVVVLRPSASRYMSVEYGPPAGGHGHPDRMHLTVFDGRALLADFGTGSYVRPSLHWYRSTLAHNAIGVGGTGQVGVAAACTAVDTSGEWGWCQVRSEHPFGAESAATRSVIVGPGFVVDVMEIVAPDDVTVDLALHPLSGIAVPSTATIERLPSAAGAGHESGYDLPAAEWRPTEHAVLSIGDGVSLRLVPRDGERLFIATAPGPPTLDYADGAPCPFLIRRAAGSGTWVHVIDAADAGLVSCRLGAGGTLTFERDDGSVLEFAIGDGRAAIRATVAPGSEQPGARKAEQEIELGGGRQDGFARGALPPDEPAFRIACPRLERAPEPTDPPAGTTMVLERSHYRRSEEPHDPVSGIDAEVGVAVAGPAVLFTVAVHKDQTVFRPPDAIDAALDNEAADIHSDGVQCYVARDGWEGYVVVPEARGRGVRARAVAGTGGDATRVSGAWRPTAAGYALTVAVDTGRPFQPGDRFRFDLVVNEMRPGRARRAGQLALRGGGWVYLRGDREPAFGAPEATVR